VKGISDFGDSEKGRVPDAYEEALKNTAIALKEWVIHTIPAMNWLLDEDDQPGVSLSHGYYNNFVRHVLDSYSQGLVAQKKITSYEPIPEEVKGLRIIMPDKNNPEFFAEAGHIGRIMREYQLQEVNIGQFNFTRGLYYKAGWLFDFPRTINGLVQYPDPTHQVELFASRLQQREYFSSPVKGKEPLALLYTWDEFVDWLEDTKEEEKAKAAVMKPSPVVDVPGPETVDQKVIGNGTQQENNREVTTGDGGQREDSRENESTPTLKTFPLTATEQLVVGEGILKKKRSIFKFWHKNGRAEKTLL